MAFQESWDQNELDSAETTLAVIDASGAVIRANKQCSAAFALKADELHGKSWLSLLFPEEKGDQDAGRIQQLLDDDKATRQFLEAQRTRANGRIVAWRYTPITNIHGKVDRLLCQGSDISAQLERESSLQLVGEESAALYDLLHISLEDIPLNKLFERFLDVLLALSWLKIEPKGGIFQVAAQDEALILKAQRGLSPEIQSSCKRVEFGHCLCGMAAATQQVQYAACIDHRHEVAYPGIKPHGHYNIPILSQHGLLGVMVLYLQEGHPCQTQDVKFLTSVANTLASLIEHRQTQDALTDSRERLVQTQRLAHLGGLEWDMVLDQITLSDEAARILGWQPSDKPRPMADFIACVHADDYERTHREINTCRNLGADLNVDFRIGNKDNPIQYVHAQANVVRNESGQATTLNGTLQDITQRKSAENQLRLSAAVFENTTEGIMISDIDNRIVAVNKAFVDITGYSRDEVEGKTPAILKSDRHDANFFAEMWQSLQHHGRWQGEIWNQRKNGEPYPEWLSISTLKTDDGDVTHYVSVFSDITAIKASESKIDELAHHDILTGLPNRLDLTIRMERALAHARRDQKILAVMFLDLDHFKDVNDTLGHPVGDLLIQESARRIKSCLREEDTIARLGGDEFTIMLEDLQESRHAGAIAHKINQALAEKFVLNEHEIFISCSIGISLFPDDGRDITTLLQNADSALHRAKEQGRNNYQYYTEALTVRAVTRMHMESELRTAIAKEQLTIHYQPQSDTKTGKIIGMEALLRWQHPERGLMLPGAFIPLAEESGLILQIDKWVLRTACARLKGWIDQGLPPIHVAVNVSSRLFNQKNLAEIVIDTLNETGLDPHCLELELTERIVMEDAEIAVQTLRRLKALGVQIAIDDFGTGYSSLSYLKRFPIDRIKIDQSFVRNITTDADDATIAHAIISLSRSMNLRTVAEGVETREQQEFLHSLKCDEVQGFYFSHPLPEQAMEQLLRNSVKQPVAEPSF